MQENTPKFALLGLKLSTVIVTVGGHVDLAWSLEMGLTYFLDTVHS